MSDEPSVESTEQGEDEPLSPGCLSATNRHDVDRIWSRFRETDESINGVRMRVTVLEQRVSNIDDRLAEQRVMLLDLRASVRHVDREVTAMHLDLSEMRDHQRTMVGAQERFTVAQCRHSEERTEAMHKMVRILIGIFAALGVLSVSTVSLMALAGERGMSLLRLIPSLFGFSV